MGVRVYARGCVRGGFLENWGNMGNIPKIVNLFMVLARSPWGNIGGTWGTFLREQLIVAASHKPSTPLIHNGLSCESSPDDP